MDRKESPTFHIFISPTDRNINFFDVRRAKFTDAHRICMRARRPPVLRARRCPL